MAARYWSVERDGDTVLATCPEPLRYASDTRPEWMTGCAAAIRDELRLLEIREGTLLEATLTGEPPPGADLENLLLYNVGIPQAQVHAGVRLRRNAASGHGVEQRYRRVPFAGVELGDAERPLAAVRVPITDEHELETARTVWLAARRAIVRELPEDVFAPAAIDLRVRVCVGASRTRGSVELIKKLLDGVCSAFHAYTGANLEEVTRRIARELGEDSDAMRALAISPRGALLGGYDCFWLRGERVQVSPADDRIHAAEVVFVAGGTAQLEVELRAPAAPGG